MTAPTLPEDPLFIERLPGVGLINAFEDLLLRHDITPVFVHKVVAREKHEGRYFLNGYFAFEKRQKTDIDYILYQIMSIIEEFGTKHESGENTPRGL